MLLITESYRNRLKAADIISLLPFSFSHSFSSTKHHGFCLRSLSGILMVLYCSTSQLAPIPGRRRKLKLKAYYSASSKPTVLTNSFHSILSSFVTTSKYLVQEICERADRLTGRHTAERADLPLRRSSPFCCIPLHVPLHAPAIFQRPLTAPLRSNQFCSRSIRAPLRCKC